MRRLGLLAVPVVIVVGFLGLLIGLTGLCGGADGMAGPDGMPTLCLFFCGVITPAIFVLAPLWVAFLALVVNGQDPLFATPRSIFHPPTASAA